MNRGTQLVRHIAYNIGRVSSYIILGMIFGAIGSLFALSMELHGTLFIFAGIVMFYIRYKRYKDPSKIRLKRHVIGGDR